MLKEKLPKANKPFNHGGVEGALDVGIPHMAIIASSEKCTIENYFDVIDDLELQIAGTDKNILFKLMAYKFERRSFDCGNLQGYINATNITLSQLNSWLTKSSNCQ